MAKERLIFIVSFAFLALISAVLFRHTESPKIPNEKKKEEAEKTAEEKKTVAQVEEKRQEMEVLPLSEGKLAVSFQFTSRQSIVQFMSPGKYVDILFTTNSDNGLGILSLTLLKNIRILAIGADFDSKSVNPNKGNMPIEILLEMTPRESEVFSYAEQSGKISFAIRTEGEISQSEEKDQLVKDLLKSHSDVSFNSIIATYMIHALFPNVNVKVTSAPRGYVLEGMVTDAKTSQNIVKIMDMLSASGEKSVVNLIQEQVPSIEVLIAKQDLKTGEHLKSEDYEWLKIKQTELTPSLITRNLQSEKWLNESVVEKGVNKGEMINIFDITWPREFNNESEIDANSLSPDPNKLEVPFPVPARALIIQFLKPGVYVDIKFTSKLDIGFGSEILTLLKDVRILAIRENSSKKFHGKSSFYNPNAIIEVFLEMTPRQAEIFGYALQTGNVSLEVANNMPEKNVKLAQALLSSESVRDFDSILITYMIRSLFPIVNVKITATPRGYIAEGNVPDPQIATKIMEILAKIIPGGDKAIINLMEVEPQQVLLAVKILELQRDLITKLGLNWKALFANNGTRFALGAVYPTPGLTDPDFFFRAFGKAGNFTLSALVNMLEEDGYAKVLAEPNITTISGETAHFFAGGEFPILIPQGGLVGAVTVEFKKYGVLVDFSPLVDLTGLITLHVVPEVSNLDPSNGVSYDGFVVPALLTRRVDTVVKLWPGQSYLIAGMFLDEIADVNDNLYGLNKLPIIGGLFSSESCADKRTELVVIVTPYLINNDDATQAPPCRPLECKNKPNKLPDCKYIKWENPPFEYTKPEIPENKCIEWEAPACNYPASESELPIEEYDQWEVSGHKN